MAITFLMAIVFPLLIPYHHSHIGGTDITCHGIRKIFCYFLFYDNNCKKRNKSHWSSESLPEQSLICHMSFHVCVKSSSKCHEMSAFFFIPVIIRDIAGGCTAFFLSLYCFLFFFTCSYLHNLLCIYYISR